MTIYKLRGVCETDIGDGKGAHYFYVDQEDAVNEIISCPEHADAVVRDVAIIEISVVQ